MYMYQIVANHVDGVDVDKLDYVQRDAAQTGLRFSIDIDRFFSYARVVKDRLCYSLKHMPHAINHLFMARHQLHARVYQHAVVRAIECMYLDVLRVLGDSALFHKDLMRFQELTDNVFTDDFVRLEHARGRLSLKRAQQALGLLKRIDRRDIYTLVFETTIPSCIRPRVEALQASATSDFVIDVAHFGYKVNPLFDVAYYNDSGALSSDGGSTAFPVHPEDLVARIYARDASFWRNSAWHCA